MLLFYDEGMAMSGTSPSIVKKSMKEIHHIAIKYLTYLVLNKRKN